MVGDENTVAPTRRVDAACCIGHCGPDQLRPAAQDPKHSGGCQEADANDDPEQSDGRVETLYLLFFLLRDGDALAERIKAAIPLSAEQKNALFRKFSIVIRATVKGDLVVALLQGVLGGAIFSFSGITTPPLWAVLMAIFLCYPWSAQASFGSR